MKSLLEFASIFRSKLPAALFTQKHEYYQKYFYFCYLPRIYLCQPITLLYIYWIFVSWWNVVTLWSRSNWNVYNESQACFKQKRLGRSLFRNHWQYFLPEVLLRISIVVYLKYSFMPWAVLMFHLHALLLLDKIISD